MHTKSESDVTSLAPSSPSRSPKRPVYYVQSPSRDSHDGDKSSSMQATPNFNSPMESPSHPSFGRHSRNSSGSRFSGIFRSSSGRKMGRKRNESNDKGWPECKVILEEGNYDGMDDEMAFARRCQALLALLGFVVLFTVFCLIIWGAGRPYKAEVAVKDMLFFLSEHEKFNDFSSEGALVWQETNIHYAMWGPESTMTLSFKYYPSESLAVNNMYVGPGSDFSGVVTNLLTMNSTLRINVYNPATFFGIHVKSTPISLVYSDVPVATGQLKKYYQPRKSHRLVAVNLEGTRVPLYGAGANLTVTNTNAVQVPMTLQFELHARGNLVGQLVKTTHRIPVSCSIVIDSTSTKPIKFKKNSCVRG